MNKGFMILGAIAVVGGVYYLMHNNILHFPPKSEAKVTTAEDESIGAEDQKVAEEVQGTEEQKETQEAKAEKPSQKNTVIVFGTPQCHYCTMAKNFLQQRNIHYIDKDITDDEARAEMDKYVPNAKYVPQIVIGETPIGGYRELIELQHQGKLTKMINGKA
jgi:glutaredoxin 3